MKKSNPPSNTATKTTTSGQKNMQSTPVLNETINMAIAEKIIAITPAPEVANRIKAKLMQRVQAKTHQFVFANQGHWKQIFEGIEIKLLWQEGERKSFLMKLAAKARIPAHPHLRDEEAYVLEGSVEIEGILCHVGDYHFAKAGSQHQNIYSELGCTLLIKSS